MNRRGFLKLAGAAPLAAPAIAQAAAEAMQPQLRFGELLSGEHFHPVSSFEYQLSPRACASITRYDAGRLIETLTAVEPDPSVIAQMIEHDLFEGLAA